MGRRNEYQNLIAFHPGIYVEELIEETNLSQAELAQRLGITEQTISRLIDGDEPINQDLARRLADFSGISLQTWLNLQAKYDDKVAEIEAKQKKDNF
ncbi:HigA family addiction module antitoxin [Fructobacillus ficulneus]|uniref:DNA-binding protein n=1 Tax=Fructobacillus ficulneus TaxID=157463 RepID=A0A0K8MJ28_9LACO|nr:HigA family addiction module antitoxin [Fructobacillus ficulneus]GAO99894.1 DNA-binding protein [Fructobacillus ficulneus]